MPQDKKRARKRKRRIVQAKHEPAPREGDALPLASDFAAMFPKPAIEDLLALIDEKKVPGERKEPRLAKQVERFGAVLRSLDALVIEMRAEREEQKKLAAEVAEVKRLYELQQARYRTGKRGRPGSWHIVKPQILLRIDEGEVASSMAAEGRETSVWLARCHPDAHPMNPNSIRNAIGEDPDLGPWFRRNKGVTTKRRK